jgi:hypothetical protein
MTDYEQQADALEKLRLRVDDADSIADDVPVLSSLFHKARTSGRSGRDGRYVAVYDYDADTEEWHCRFVSWLENGMHYRDLDADLVLYQRPAIMMGVDEFRKHKRAEIKRRERSARQNAANMQTTWGENDD